MAKQKCGTCRYFQEAGLAGSGWCHHPQRKVSSGVMIMVRRNELACRDEWSRSLWTANEADDADGETPFQRPATMGPVAPANVDHLRSLLRADSPASSETEAGEDVLLSEARIVSENREAPPPRREQSGTPFDPRTAVFRAREAYRERARAKATAARQSAGAEPLAGARGAAGDGLASEPPLEASHESSPPAEQEPEPAPAFEEMAPVSQPLAATRSIASEAGMGRSAAAGIVKDQSMIVPEAGTSAVVEAEPLADWSLERFLMESAEPADAVCEEVEAPAVLVPKRRNELDERQLPEWFRTDLPRICRTCRDYRPSAEGQRGWCANAWAFTHRRLVHEDDPAPCDSSIGDWWAPVDDVWLVAADVSSHGRATPLLDRLVGKEPAARRRS